MALALSAVVLTGACAQVLGIEDAELDPLIGGNALCDEYCTTVLDSCKGPFAVYTSVDTCKAVCAALPAGAPGSQIGNNVQCRLNQAKAAGTTGEFADHCPPAGPGGDGVCGSNCEAFCLVLEASCKADFDRVYMGRQDACQDDCDNTIIDCGGFDVSEKDGPDSIGCRLYHVSAAAPNQPVPHCKHSIGDELCVPAGDPCGMGGAGGAGGMTGGGGASGGPGTGGA